MPVKGPELLQRDESAGSGAVLIRHVPSTKQPSMETIQRSRRRRPPAEVRERIVAAAERLVAAHGYTNTGVAAIAQEADVAAGSIYQHFASKAALFDEVFRRAAGRELDAVRQAAAAQSGTRERLQAIVETFARRALHSGRLAWALLAEPVDPVVDAERLAFRRAYRDALATVLADGAATGQFRVEDLELTAAALVGAIAEALLGPLSPLSDRSLDEDQLLHHLVRISLQIAGAHPRGPDKAQTP